jgi:hypothetical protein
MDLWRDGLQPVRQRFFIPWALAPEVQVLNFSGIGSKSYFPQAELNAQSSGHSTNRASTGFM